MYLSINQWEAFYAFLLVEVKLKPNRNTQQRNLSNFRLIVNFLNSRNLPWSRSAFNALIAESIKSGKSASQRNNLLKTGKHLDKFLKTNELDGFTYFKERPPKDVEIFTPEEINSIINLKLDYRGDSEYLNARASTLLSVLWDTGCRISETRYLLWADVKDAGQFCAVIFRDTKSNEDRTSIITRSTYQAIMKLPRIGQYVFSLRPNQPFDRSAYAADLTRRIQTLGIPKKIKPHLIRHSMISFCGNSGMPTKLLMGQVGHKSMEVTERYLHNDLYDLKKSLTEYHPDFQEELSKEMQNKMIRDYVSRVCGGKRPSTISENAGHLNIDLP